MKKVIFWYWYHGILHFEEALDQNNWYSSWYELHDRDCYPESVEIDGELYDIDNDPDYKAYSEERQRRDYQKYVEERKRERAEKIEVKVYHPVEKTKYASELVTSERRNELIEIFGMDRVR